jgi:putative ABC transport system permease protein
MFGWDKRRKQLLEEFEQHIELEVQENLEAGMSPQEARSAARKKFGNLLLAAEDSQAVWRNVWLENLLLDLRYAIRGLKASRAYTATLVCTLVLGLGAATTMLAISKSILATPLTLPHSEQLVQIYSEEGVGGTHVSPYALTYKVINALQRDAGCFAYVAGYNTVLRPVTTAEGARVTLLTEVTAQFFPMLGIQPRLGRFIGAGDAKASVVLVSHEFWRERLHSESNVIGSTIKVSGRLRTIIGVMPPGFHAPQGTGAPMLYVPISINPSGQDELMMESASTIARLRPGVSEQQALANARAVFAHAEKGSGERNRRLAMRSYREFLVGGLREPLMALLGGVGVLLLIACANAANLQIGRAASRLSEMTTRSALGASFGRLMQQLITESVLVSLLGAGFGGALSFAAVALIRHAYGQEFSRFDELSIQPAVLGWTALLAVIIGAAASIAPILNVRRQARTQDQTRTVTRRSRLPRVLVAAQVGLTCVLLVVSGLFVRTLHSLENVKLGFDPKDVTTLVLMPEQQNQDPERSRSIETRLLHRFETLPGVQSVTMQTEVPFSSYNMTLNGATEVSGRPFKAGDSAFYSMVSTNFVRTSGIRLLRGRSFEASDVAGSAMVVLINQAFEKKYLDSRNPIGTSIRFHRNAGETDADLPFVQPMTIIGVVENEIQGGDLGAPYQPMIYLDYLQLPKGSLLGQVFNMSAQYAIRSPLAPATLASELRAATASEAPGMVEMNLQTMQSAIAQSLGQRRLALRLVAGFGLIALALSAVGIYGVLAYSVAVRRREIGIRMALGSTRSRAASLVMNQAAAMALVGLIPGLAGAWVAGRAVRSFLFGVGTFDPVATVAAALALAVVFAVASSLPAMRAAKVDPAETLREQ